MIKFVIGSLLMLISLQLFAQNQAIYIYDLTANSIDSISIVPNVDARISDSSPFSFGNYNTTIANLPQSTDGHEVFDNTNFTIKEKAVLDFDLTDFPIRTSVKLFGIQEGAEIDWCSGSMISGKHVLTAAHCLVAQNSNTALIDSFLVCPVYDNGVKSSEFECSLANKIYFNKDWDLPFTDIAVIELADPIGLETGYLGIGFNNSANYYEEGFYYKFSYPIEYFPHLDSTEYNGDTLYSSFGNIDLLDSNSIGVVNAFGIPGESGSSFISSSENEFISHGVFSTSQNFRHTRIKDWMYYTIVEKIINQDITNPSINTTNEIALNIYPNPVNDLLTVECNSSLVNSFEVFNNLGQKMLGITMDQNTKYIDVSELNPGIFYINFTTNKGNWTEKIMKY